MNKYDKMKNLNRLTNSKPPHQLESGSRKNKAAAFTVIEIIVVMAIIAILVLFAGPFYKGYTIKAAITAAQYDARIIETALEAGSVKNEKIYDSVTLTPADSNTINELWESGRLIDIRGPVTRDISGEIFYEMPGTYIRGELEVKRESKAPAYTTKDGYVVIGLPNSKSTTNSGDVAPDKVFSANEYFTVNESGTLTQYHPTGKVWGDPLPRIYDLVVPEVYIFDDGSTVTITKIGDGVFQEIPWDRRDIESVILPDTIKTIGKYAFEGTTMESIILPDGLEDIQAGAFENGKLKSLNLGSGVKTIGNFAFKNNDIENLVIPGNVWSIGEESFGNNNLHTVSIENGVNTIERQAFYGNPIQILTLGDSIEHIGTDAFRRGINYMEGVGLLTELDLPDNIKTIGSHSFYQHSIEHLSLPASLEIIGQGAFEANEITRLEFSPSGKLHTIENNAFSYNKITELTIPSSVRNIGDNAFFRNYLDNLTIEEGLTSLNGYHSFDFASTFSPVVYRATLSLPNSLTYIRDNAFGGGATHWNSEGYSGEWLVELDMYSGSLKMLKQ